MASDAEISNVVSHAFHAAVGFEETERVVFFRKPLLPRTGDVPVAGGATRLGVDCYHYPLGATPKTR